LAWQLALLRIHLGFRNLLFYKPTENPRVGGSIPPLATILFNDLRRIQN
jgi:hypothetical protein